MNFTITERETHNLDELYPLFKKEYLNPQTTVSEVKKKLHLTNSEYKHLRKELEEETGVDFKPNPYNKYGRCENEDKYIHRQKDRYIIMRVINKKRVYYGQSKTLEEARVIRDKLKEHNWDKGAI